jgi:predicted O-methyltransferase YrrM
MLQKYIKKFKRELLKRDAKAFSNIIKKYDLNIFLNDTENTLFKIEHFDNFKTLLVEKNYLDGNIINLIKKLNQNNKHDICIDIGANFGLVSVLLAHNSSQVYAFEPEPSNIKRMEEIISTNKIENIEIINKAVSPQMVTPLFLLQRQLLIIP